MLYVLYIDDSIFGQTDVVRWDATRIPLRTNSVDVFVTDLVSK